MALIEWRAEFRTGIPSVDHEHAELIRLLNDAHARLARNAGADEIADVLGEILAGTSAHFALEEQIMRERRYDFYAVHKDDHERLLDDIREVMDAQHRGDFAGSAMEQLSHRLDDWFSVHFRTHDARLHRLLGVS
jgi:hemerythrin